MDKLIKALMEAPEWFRVRSVTVESAEGRKTMTRDELAGYAFPMGAFRLTVDLAPTRRD